MTDHHHRHDEHGHDRLGDRLRRAVATLPAVEPDWATTDWLVRRARFGRAALRVGVPAACALLAVGGIVVLAERGGEQMSGSPAVATPAPALTSPAPAPAPGSATASTAGVPTPSSDATFGDPSTWPVLGRSRSFGTWLELRVVTMGDEVCVSAAADGERPTWGSCAPAGRYGVRLVDGRLHVLGTVVSSSNLRLATTGGSADMPTFDIGSVAVFASVLPDGADLTAVGEAAALADCPYRPLLQALDASADIAPDLAIVATVERCAAGFAGLVLHGGPGQPGGQAVLRAAGTGWTVVNVGAVCPPVVTELERVACEALGWSTAPEATTVVTGTTATSGPTETTVPAAATVPVTVDRAPVGAGETIPALPAS